MIPVTESKKQTYSLLSEEDLRKEAQKLSNSDDSNIRLLGEEILRGLETSFENVNQIVGTISNILLLGLFVTPTVILCVLSVISIMIITLPLQLIKNILNSQIRFLRGRLKPDENIKRYYSAVSILLKDDTAKELTLESVLPVMEAPKEITTDDGDDTPINYDYDAANDDNPEPNNYDDDLDTQEDDDTDDTTDTEDSSEDDTDNTTSEDDSSDEIDDEEPNNYDDDLDTQEDDDTDDTTDTEDSSDDSMDDQNDEDNIQIGNNRIKNYNLMLQFQKMYNTTDDLIQHLKSVYYHSSIQNSVLNRCYNNVSKLKEEILYYIEFNFSKDYKQNLYYYNIYIQSLRINLEIMSKISDLDEDGK